MIFKIELENYRQFAAHTETFHAGFNIISGGNGTGKSTIVEAIAYTLFGNALTKGPANSWIKRGQKHGKATLYVDDYIIIRGDNEQLVTDTNGEILAKQNVGLNQWVLETYGLTPDLFVTASYIAQKDVESFASLQTAERIKRIEKLLGIDVLDLFKEFLKKKGKELKTAFLGYKEQLNQVNFLGNKHLKDTKKSRAALAKKIPNIKTRYEDLFILKGKSQEQLILWNKKVDLKKKLAEVVFQDIKYTVEEISIMLNQLELNVVSKEALVKMVDVTSLNNTEELADLQEKVTILKSEHKSLKTIKKDCPTCGQKIPNADVLIKKCKDIEQRLIKLNAIGYKLTQELRKFNLETQIQEVAEDQETLEQMLKDLEKAKYSIQYEVIKDITEPEPVNVDPVRIELREAEKHLQELTELIGMQEQAKPVVDSVTDPKDQAEEEMLKLASLVKYIDKYRKEFSQNIIPLIIQNANVIFHAITNNKFSDMKINKDYSVDDYDFYSGSEGDAASFALRMAIAQVSRIKGFNTIILDEIASSFDKDKEDALLEILGKTAQQLIYISHGDIL